ncbi:MAG: 30S ribosomal protein S9 [Candidatus Bruticola sp.]
MPKVKLAIQSMVYQATGRRKRATARVRLVPGDGRIFINKRPYEEYFPRATQQMLVRSPLELTKTEGKFNVYATCDGGGVSGQAGAVKHGIARALEAFDGALRTELKRAGFMTRDSREKERKKYGRKRARRGFQWTKR